jgi:putative membrane protein
MSKAPRAFRLDDPQVRLSTPATAAVEGPPPRGAIHVEETEAVFDEAIVDEALETRKAELGLSRRVFGWGGLLASAAGGLALLWLTLSIEAFVTDLVVRSPVLGAIAMVLAGLCALALLVLAGRELLAIRRGRAIGRLKARAEAVLVSDDRREGRAILAELDGLYRTRPETARGRARLAETADAIIDGADLVRVAERELLAPLDLEARAAVASAARRVSIVTAISPRAIVDVLFVAAQALRLVRRISAIYGGRPGMLGFVRLLEAVGAHLAVTGGMAVGDGIVQQVLGHGIAARLSARLGEGVLNGLLTARVGLSAIAVCRPLPFAASEPPALREVAGFLLERAPKAGSAD